MSVGPFLFQANCIKKFLDCPDVIRDCRFRRRSNSQGLVNPAEIVVHVEDRQRIGVVLDLL